MNLKERTSKEFMETVEEWEVMKDHLIDNHKIIPESERGTNIYEFQLLGELAYYKSFVKERGLEGEFQEFQNELIIDLQNSPELDELEKDLYGDQNDQQND